MVDRESGTNSGHAALVLDPPQLARLAAVLRSGFASPRASLDESGVIVSLERVAVCALSEFPERAVFDDGDMLACVRCRIADPVSGVGIFALDPHHVLRLVGRGARMPDPGVAPDPGLVERYLAFGHGVLAALAGSLSQALGREPACYEASLVEGALVPCVLSTHALPDTVLVSVGIVFGVEGDRLPGIGYLMLDPKRTARLFESLPGAR